MRSRLLLVLATTAALAAAPAPPGPRTGTAPPPPAGPLAKDFWAWQERPAMGWNSWDCFGAGVNEEQTLANADYMEKHLKSHGYTLVTVDIQWYEPQARTDRYRPNAQLEMDENGRLRPAANRFPSSKDTRGFKPLADQLHAKGLKFGIHLLRGIPRQAVRDNVPILGTNVRAADIANTNDPCPWNTDMWGIDMTKPGAQAYYDSVFALVASWDVDFVKVDDLSARIYHKAEIEAIRKAIDKTGRPMVFSTSPGATPVAEGPHVQDHANQWRISDDFWDTWPALQEQFKRLDDWTPYRGPGHFPDADMLPVGAIRTWQPNGWTRFTQDEQVTLMTLWSIARSPLIIGGDLPKNDEFTLKLLTNDEILKVDQYSTNNRQLMHDGPKYAWVADAAGSDNKYVALFNAPPGPPPGRRGRGAATAPAPAAPPPPGPLAVAVPVALLKLDPALEVKNIRDLWAHKDLGAADEVTATLAPHAAALFEIQVGKK